LLTSHKARNNKVQLQKGVLQRMRAGAIGALARHPL
jgi:hypothetical protein